MRINKSQRDGLAGVGQNLASAFAAISIIGYFAFDVSAASAVAVFVLAVVCVIASLAIRGIQATDGD